MRVSRPRASGVTVAVVFSILVALGVALATRTAPPAGAVDTAAIRAETATPQALSMGGAVPVVPTGAEPTWAIRSRQSRVSDLASVYFVDDQEGFAGGYGSLLVTHDGGASWTAASIPDVGGAFAALACTSAADCLAGGWTATDDAQLVYTRDGGSTWQPARLPPKLRDLTHIACWSPSRCTAVGQGLGQGPWEVQSSDAGRTWTQAAAPPGVKSLTVFACSAGDTCLAGGGSAAFTNSAPSGVGVMDRSGDGGQTWRPVPLPPVPPLCGTPLGGTYGCSGPLGTVATGTATTPSWPPRTMSCASLTTCYEVNGGPVPLASTDGGATWQFAPVSRVVGCRAGDTFCPAFQPAAVTFVTDRIGWRTTYDPCGGFNFAVQSYQSCPAHVEKTTDGGRTWSVSAVTDYLPAISCPDPSHCWAVETTNSSGSVISTADGGAHWSVDPLPGTGLLYNLTCANVSLCFASGSDAAGDPSVLRSRDGGRTWTPSTIPVPAPSTATQVVGPRGSYISGLACPSATTCLAATTAQLFETRDGGDTWSIVWSPPPSPAGGTPTVFGLACPSPATCIAASSGGLFRSVDSGRTWVRSGAQSAGSLVVVCSPAGVCVADDLGAGGSRNTGLLVSADAGNSWRSESVPLPAGLTKNNSGTSQTPSEVYYLSCWTRERCAALGLAFGDGGAKRWYVLDTGDSGRSWSTHVLPGQIDSVGSLACGAGGRCLIAGSRTDRAGLWSLDGSTVRSLTGPAWGRFARLTSLVCPSAGSCVGTGMANNTAFVFAVSIPADASGWTDSLPTPGRAFSNVGVDVTSAAVAAGAALFITFPSQLFNLTFQENYTEIVAWTERARRRLRRIVRGGRARSADAPRGRAAVASGGGIDHHEDRSRPMEALAVGLAGALLGTLLDPAIALDRATLSGYLGVALALVASLGCVAGSLALYRWRRRLHDPLHVRALPLGLVVAAACVVVSRLVNFEPGYLYGVVCGVALGRRLRQNEEAHVAALATTATLVLAAISWAVWVPVHDAVRHGGFFLSILDSALVALVVSGLVNTVIVLLPLRFLAGWTLFRWRRAVWATAFAVALFGLIALLARSPVSPAAHASPVAATIAMFAVFGGGSVVFREYFDRQWRRAHGVEVHGLRAHVRALFSARAADDVAVIGAPGAAQVVMEDDDAAE